MLLNLTNLRELANGDNTFIKQMLEMYLGKIDFYSKELIVLYDTNKWIDLKDTAHKARSAVAILGIQSCDDMLYKVEMTIVNDTAKDDLKSDIVKAVDILKESRKEVEEEIEKLLN